MKLAEGIKAYISKVTENIISKQTFIEARTMPRLFNTSGSRLGQVTQRPSAHLTLRDTNSLARPLSPGFPSLPSPTPGLHQSCRHVVRSWANQSFVGAHLHNMTLTNGQAAGARRTGGYYLVIPQTFRYPVPRPGRRGPTQRSAQPTQLVPVRSTKRDVLPPSPIQLLKGVGTKCWPDAEYALHSVYQGGLFELRAGDELFVSVSSPTMVNADDSSSYFGAFRLDL
uniref:TNF superfamily member 10, like n=1 Tax=Tetraodon nigroviridis TaxID=99883 RepID=H3CJS6_TETNG